MGTSAYISPNTRGGRSSVIGEFKNGFPARNCYEKLEINGTVEVEARGSSTWYCSGPITITIYDFGVFDADQFEDGLPVKDRWTLYGHT
jgi:hypothetical protein